MDVKTNKGVVGVVDDKAAIREMLKELLEMEGFTVYTGADGYQAIELVTHQSLDLLLLDLSMPNMNGLEAGKQIHDLDPAQKIVFLTGYDEEIFLEEIRAIGDYEYLAKPFNLSDIVQKVKDSVDEWILL